MTEISISSDPSASAVLPGANAPFASLMVRRSDVARFGAEMSIRSVFVTVAPAQADPPNSIAEPFRIKVGRVPEPMTAVTVAAPASNEQEVATLARAVVGGTNTLPANPPPTFTCTFTNDGQNNETNVVVKVQVGGTSISGQSITPQTVPGHQYTAQVQLSSAPPAGSYTVTATVEKVPGETVSTHNTQTFPVTFH